MKKQVLFDVENEQKLYTHKSPKLKHSKALEILKPENMPQFLDSRNKKWYTIGEVEKEIEVPASRLRHWEKEGLIKPDRHPESGYRVYDREDIRRLLIIRTVQSSLYFLDSVREVMEKINHHSISEVRKIAMDSLAYMDYQIEQQLRAAYYLYELIELLKKKENDS